MGREYLKAAIGNDGCPSVCLSLASTLQMHSPDGAAEAVARHDTTVNSGTPVPLHGCGSPSQPSSDTRLRMVFPSSLAFLILNIFVDVLVYNSADYHRIHFRCCVLNMLKYSSR